jgi:septal ring factor EnvC (AmiA/AmiB activator)
MAAELRDKMVELKKNLDDVEDTESSVRKIRARARQDMAVEKNAQPKRTYKQYNKARGRNRGGKA